MTPSIATARPCDPDLTILRWLKVEDINDGDWSLLLAPLSAAERAKADSFRFLADQRGYIAAHWLARTLIGQVLGAPAADLRFRISALGKPEIDSGLPTPGPCFNLSHTRGLVAVAVSRRMRIGVDVERTDGPPPDAESALGVFSPAENDDLLTLPADRRVAAAFAIWTVKEAYAKATGQGLTTFLETVSVSLDPVGLHFSKGPPNLSPRWASRLWRPTPAHVMALVIDQPPGVEADVDARALNPAELFAGRAI